MIKRLFSILTLSFLVCFSANQIYAENYECHFEKMYVAPDQVILTHEGIFVLLNGEAIPVSELFSDSEGIFIFKRPPGYWVCRNGHPNPP